MSMAAITFDSLDYFERLKDAGVPEAQAKVQADVMRQQEEERRQQTEAQRAALQAALDKLDETTRKELATKGDVRESELRLQKEIEQVRGEIKERELRLQKEIEQVKCGIKDAELRLLKWQFGIGLALAAIMAKGFGWLGF